MTREETLFRAWVSSWLKEGDEPLAESVRAVWEAGYQAAADDEAELVQTVITMRRLLEHLRYIVSVLMPHAAEGHPRGKTLEQIDRADTHASSVLKRYIVSHSPSPRVAQCPG